MRTVITGSQGALGRAVVAALVSRGDELAVINRTAGEAQSDDIRQIAGGDLSNAASSGPAIAEAHAAMGGIDALVLLAGGFAWAPIESGSVDIWRDQYRDNLESVLVPIKAALPLLAQGASITCIGAWSAQPAHAGMGPYAAAKSAVARLVEALAEELKPRGIRINAVLPSIMDTPRNRAELPDAAPSDWTTTEAVADVIAFLTSRQARAINGALIPTTNNA